MASKRTILILALCLAALAAVSLAYAQGGFDLLRWTADGGGGTSSGGDYVLSGTAGQAEVSPPMQGGTYELTGGFWGVGTVEGYEVHLPAVLRSWP